MYPMVFLLARHWARAASLVDKPGDRAPTFLPADPVWHRTGDLSHRGRSTDAQKNRVSQLGEACPSIRFYTWWNWSSEEPKDASKSSSKVTELLNRISGPRKLTSWIPGLQFHIHSSPTHHGQGSSLRAKVSANRPKQAMCHIVLSPAPLFSNKVWQ